LIDIATGRFHKVLIFNHGLELVISALHFTLLTFVLSLENEVTSHHKLGNPSDAVLSVIFGQELDRLRLGWFEEEIPNFELLEFNIRLPLLSIDFHEGPEYIFTSLKVLAILI
jgi:hypothetical protein